MSSRMALTSQMMWAMKYAFEKVDVRTTVLGFSNGWTVLYRPSEKAVAGQYRAYNALGGTDPLDALKQARKLLLSSDRPNRVLATITDGEWFTSDNNVLPIMQDLHHNGATTLLLGIGGHGVSNLHGHQLGFKCNKLEDMPHAISKLVGEIMRRAARLSRV
jgi:hypothetical protein